MMRRIYMLLCVFVISSFLCVLNVCAIYTEEGVGTYEEELAKFPISFKSKIESLHKIYPNSVFVAQNKFFDWGELKEVEVEFNRMMSYQYYETGSKLSYASRSRNLVYYTMNVGYRSNADWSYNYYTDKYTAFDNGSWYAAAKNTISYYLDARNFLDESNVFIFESLYNHEYQKIEGVEKILSGTFMANKECPGSEGKKYSEVLIEAADKNSISAYYLASRIRQEQGTKGTSNLISGTYKGYEGYYNYFNISASGNGTTTIVTNGLTRAKEQGWTSPYLSILGGSTFVRNDYVGANDKYNVKGQLTLYLNKWDPYGYNLGGHQYMQNITAPITEASTILNAYKIDKNYKNNKYIFYIPVFKNMPNSTSLPKMGNPNNYLKTLTVDGASVSNFDGAKTSYEYNVSSSTTSVYVDYTKVAKTSSVTGAGTINLDNNIKTISVVVTAENGDKKTYSIKINKSNDIALSIGEIINLAKIKSDGIYLSGFILGTDVSKIKEQLQKPESKAKISITNSGGSNKSSGIVSTGDKITITSGSETKTFTVVIYGDLTGDGNINSADLLKMRQHLIGTSKLSGAKLVAANVEQNNSSINSADLLRLRQHLIGSKKINQ